LLPAFVILTGASGAGKSTIAQAIEDAHPEIVVYQSDRIGFPSDEIIASYGPMDEPGGPLQRGFALHWFGVFAKDLQAGKPVLLDAQLRIKFIHEALALHGIENARILLVECVDESREARLHGRGNPELVHWDMSNWGRYLHREAEQYGHQVLDTTHASVEQSVARVLSYFEKSPHKA
jgi:chloramphenicol 3-O-phosphotransferase